MVKIDGHLLEWTAQCDGVGGCGLVMQPVYFLLDRPLAIPTQCPRCVHMLETSEIADSLLAYRHTMANVLTMPVQTRTSGERD